MGHKFSLVLSREITDDESAILRNAGCTAAVFGTDSLPTNAEVTVTKMDFDDTISPSLAEAIESALEAVKNVPDLTVPGLTVPAQPAKAPEQGPDAVVEGVVVEEKPSTKAPRAKKAPAKKKATAEAVTANGHADKDAKDLVEAAAES